MKSHIIPTVIITVLFFVFCTIDGKDINRQDEKAPAAVPVLTEEEAEQANRRALASHASRSISKTDESILDFYATSMQKPMAVPVLSQEEAKKINREAVSLHNEIAMEQAFLSFSRKTGISNNVIHIIISLLPLFFIADALLFWRRKKRTNACSKITEYFSLSRRVRILMSVTLLAFGLLLFVPWSVYFGNSLQFPFIFQDFVNWNLRVLTISIVGACFVLLLIPPVISDYLVAMIAGLGLCVYVQAMFMNQHLGTMDGGEPEWREHCFFGTINMITWIGIVLTPIVLKKMFPSSFSKNISTTTGIILSLELLATVSMIFSAGQNVWSRPDTYFVDGSKQFQLSKTKNVIVFIFDMMGSEFVKKYFEMNPETQDIVKDFIWYKDARSNYDMTFPGLSHEVTGTLLPAPANSYYELFEKMWHSTSAKSFYKQLDDAGYDVKLYCKTNKFLIGPEILFCDYFSNIEARDISYEIDYNRLQFCLKQISGFSSVPYFFKKHFFYAFDSFDDTVSMKIKDDPHKKNMSIPNDNSAFLKKLISSGIETNADKPVFSFYYTHGAHRPWNIDEKCNKMESAFDNPYPATGSCFYVLSEFIRLLKEANIYDNTAILICSDHGGNMPRYSKPYDMTFMVKPFHENKTSLSIDDSKVQSIDILPTLLYMACGESSDFKSFDGYSSFHIPNERIRKVHRLGYMNDYPEPDPDLAKCYRGRNCLEEYIFIDLESFHFGTDSKSFVRHIPLVLTSQDNQ